MTMPDSPANLLEKISSINLSGATILAVGCGSPTGEPNNGLVAALAFAANGANVFVIDRDQTAADFTCTYIRNAVKAAQVEATVADVSSEDQIIAALTACTAAFSDPTVLYYNVGIVTAGGVLDLPAAKFSSTIDINLIGAFRCIKHVLPAMIQAGSGRIITVSSTGALRYSGYDYPAYAASKAGLIALTRSVGLQHAANGIRANCIAPGLIETPLVSRQGFGNSVLGVEQALANRHAASPTGRMGESVDVANAAVFLASAASNYVNGTVLPVDGGLIQATSRIQ